MIDLETFPGQHLGGVDTSPPCRLRTSLSPYVERHSRGLGICRLLPYKGHSLGLAGGSTSSFVGRYLTFHLIAVQLGVLDGSGNDFIACHQWMEQGRTAGEQQDICALPSWEHVFWSPGETPLTLGSRRTDERSRGCQTMLMSFQSVTGVVFELKHQFWCFS